MRSIQKGLMFSFFSSVKTCYTVQTSISVQSCIQSTVLLAQSIESAVFIERHFQCPPICVHDPEFGSLTRR